MHILYFHQHFSTPSGASGIRSYEMARRLVAAGHEVTMVCGAFEVGRTGLEGKYVFGKRTGQVDGINVIEFNLAYSNKYGFFRRILQFFLFALRSTGVALLSKYDLVFTTSTPLTAAVPGIAAKYLRRKPFVFEVRDLWPELPKAMGVITNPLIIAAMSALEWCAYRAADKIFVLAPGMSQGVMRRGISQDKIRLISNGCDLEIFRDAHAPLVAEEKNSEEFLAIFAGTHGPANGLNALLDTAAILRAKGITNINLLLVGDGKEKEELQQRAKHEALDNVLFIDPVSKKELVEYFRRADVGLQVLANIPAFYYGTSPNKFFDYISASLPVVCNYPGWVSDLLTNYKAGSVVAPDNPELFASTLVNLSKNRHELKEMSRNALRLAKEKFDREALASEFIRGLEGVYNK